MVEDIAKVPQEVDCCFEVRVRIPNASKLVIIAGADNGRSESKCGDDAR